MNKLTLYLIIIVLILLISNTFFFKKSISLNEDKIRLTDNISTLNDEITYNRTKDSLWVAQRNVLQFTKDELEKTNNKLVQQVKELNIKLKNVQSIIQINTVTKDSVILHYKDSVINDTIHTKIGYYKDKWTDISIVNDTLKYSVSTELLQVVYDSRTWWRKLLFWKPIKLRQSIKSYNPNCKITYMENITITK